MANNDMVTKIDSDLIRDTMTSLGYLLNELGAQAKSAGWGRVLEDVQGPGLLGASIRNPVGIQALKVIDKYLQELGAEAKQNMDRQPNDINRKIFEYIKQAYGDFKDAVKNGMESSPITQMQTWLRQLNLYVTQAYDAKTRQPIFDPQTKKPVFYPAPITGVMDQTTLLALQLFRKQVGLPQGGPPSAQDMQTLAKVTGNA